MPEPAGDGRRGPRPDRGQLVLAAAALIALALVPVVLAYLQLGYHPDVAASSDYDGHGENARRFLERAVHEAGANATGESAWDERDRAVDAMRTELAPRLDTLNASQVAEGVAYAVRYNGSAAGDWAAAECPGGRGREFGPCRADRGVVVQGRAGESTVLAAAFDVTVTTPRGQRELTLVVRVVG
ncbi:DUF7261 family protein [Haloglomus litoreum]|uniref:DUF7261 family protein n=1 Tax=Haloglomus litoreum TaxID=3034026 RepID=UPI0023E80BCB|nr:hypothetical protein [Haloglomus sp. DT116]